jgi:uncharacterized membrane protein
MFASLVAALVVPVGYALSVQSTQVSSYTRYAAVVPAASASAVVPVAAAMVTPMTIHMGSASAVERALRPVSDTAKLFGIGTLLFGLAAVVRKAT